MTLKQELRMSRDFSSPEEELNLNLQRTVGLLGRPLQRFLRSHGLSPAHAILLPSLFSFSNSVQFRAVPCRSVAKNLRRRLYAVRLIISRSEMATSLPCGFIIFSTRR